MRIRLIVVIMVSLFIQLFSGPLFASPCPLKKNDCSFYLCHDQWRGCSLDSSNLSTPKKKGYLLDFGFRYCKKFLDLRKGLFSSEGEGWLRNVRHCLMKKMEEVPFNVSCQSLKRKANFHHLECYYEKGFCDLPFKDKKNLMKLLGPELKRFDVVLSGLGLFFACGMPSSSFVTNLMAPF